MPLLPLLFLHLLLLEVHPERINGGGGGTCTTQISLNYGPDLGVCVQSSSGHQTVTQERKEEKKKKKKKKQATLQNHHHHHHPHQRGVGFTYLREQRQPEAGGSDQAQHFPAGESHPSRPVCPCHSLSSGRSSPISEPEPVGEVNRSPLLFFFSPPLLLSSSRCWEKKRGV